MRLSCTLGRRAATTRRRHRVHHRRNEPRAPTGRIAGPRGGHAEERALVAVQRITRQTQEHPGRVLIVRDAEWPGPRRHGCQVRAELHESTEDRIDRPERLQAGGVAGSSFVENRAMREAWAPCPSFTATAMYSRKRATRYAGVFADPISRNCCSANVNAGIGAALKQQHLRQVIVRALLGGVGIDPPLRDLSRLLQVDELGMLLADAGARCAAAAAGFSAPPPE